LYSARSVDLTGYIMNKTAFILAAKDCAAHTVYSEIGGVLLYNVIMKPALVPLTKMRMSINFGTCMMAEYIVSQEDSPAGLDIFAMGARTSLKAGLIRAARKVVWQHRSGSIGQSATCGFLGGLVNALVEPYSPVFVGDTTSLNTLAGDTTNGLCNVLFAIQSPEQCWAIMRDKVSIGVLREAFKPMAEFGGNYFYALLQDFFPSDVDSLSNIDDDKLIRAPDKADKVLVQSSPPSDSIIDGDKLIPSSDKALVQSPPGNNCNSRGNSEHAGQGQSSDCGLGSSLQHLDVCLAGEESDQSP
jgi:hypothetical protein